MGESTSENHLINTLCEIRDLVLVGTVIAGVARRQRHHCLQHLRQRDLSRFNISGLRFRVEGSGFRRDQSRFTISGFRFRVSGVICRGSRFRV